MLRRSCIAQAQPRNMSSIEQIVRLPPGHELDRTDLLCVCPERSRSCEAGINHADRADHLSEVCKGFSPCGAWLHLEKYQTGAHVNCFAREHLSQYVASACTQREDHDLDRVHHVDPLVSVRICCARPVTYWPHPANMCARAVPNRSRAANMIWIA